MVEDTHTSRPPSPTETLRRAVALMRDSVRYDAASDCGDVACEDCKHHRTMLAVADWLEAQADLYDDWADPDSLHPADLHAPSHNAALAVARAYLGVSA